MALDTLRKLFLAYRTYLKYEVQSLTNGNSVQGDPGGDFCTFSYQIRGEFVELGIGECRRGTPPPPAPPRSPYLRSAS